MKNKAGRNMCHIIVECRGHQKCVLVLRMIVAKVISKAKMKPNMFRISQLQPLGDIELEDEVVGKHRSNSDLCCC